MNELVLNFARKSENHPKYQHWFKPSEENIPPAITTRSDKTTTQTKYKPVPYRTDRYRDSPIPFMTNMLNNYHAKKK